VGWQEGELVASRWPGSLALARELAASPRREALRVVLDLQHRRRVFDPLGDASAEAAQRDAAVDALGWWPDASDGALSALLRRAHPFARPHTFLGGVGALAGALARRLDVGLDCEVRRVESDSSGAQLHVRWGGSERSVRADAVVVAVPATRAAALCPKLTPDERSFFESAGSEPATLVHLLFERAPRGLGFRSAHFGNESGLELRSLLAEQGSPGTAPHGGGVLRAALAPEAAVRMHRASDASIADLVLENLAYSPVGALRPDDFAVWRHADLAPRFDRAHCRRLARFVRRLDRSPRIAFAGDFLAGPSLDGAVTSGMRAASELLHLL
jgi:oxygen-dependent protoporphyrinogen oxidase